MKLNSKHRGSVSTHVRVVVGATVVVVGGVVGGVVDVVVKSVQSPHALGQVCDC